LASSAGARGSLVGRRITWKAAEVSSSTSPEEEEEVISLRGDGGFEGALTRLQRWDWRFSRLSIYWDGKLYRLIKIPLFHSIKLHATIASSSYLK
jgi:hypothetical protein